MIYDESVQILCLVELLDSTVENNCQTDKHLRRCHGISTTAVKSIILSMSILRALVMGQSASKARRQDNQTKHTILYTIESIVHIEQSYLLYFLVHTHDVQSKNYVCMWSKKEPMMIVIGPKRLPLKNPHWNFTSESALSQSSFGGRTQRKCYSSQDWLFHS